MNELTPPKPANLVWVYEYHISGWGSSYKLYTSEPAYPLSVQEPILAVEIIPGTYKKIKLGKEFTLSSLEEVKLCKS